MNMVETKGKTVNERFRVVAVIQIGLPQNKVVRHVVVDYVAFRQGAQVYTILSGKNLQLKMIRLLAVSYVVFTLDVCPLLCLVVEKPLKRKTE